MGEGQTKAGEKTSRAEKDSSAPSAAPRRAGNTPEAAGALNELAGNLSTQRLLRNDAAEAEARRAAALGLVGSPQPHLEGGRLDAATATHLSNVYGRDVSEVLFQRGSGVAQSQAADAVTIGDEVHLDEGVRLSAGLAAHEAAHAVQQTGGGRGLSSLPAQPLRRGPDETEPTGDEPLDPFVTGWAAARSGVLIALSDDNRLAVIPLRDSVYIPDDATAARFNPRAPKTPGPAPVFGVPAVGAAGTRVIPAGTRSAIIMDSGAGVGVSAGMYLSQFAGALQRVGIGTPTELYIMPIHAHRDHVDKMVALIDDYSIPPENILIPRGQGDIATMRSVMRALTTDATARLITLGYGPDWKPRQLRDAPGGTAGIIRLGYRAQGGVKVELVGLRGAIATAGSRGGNIDLASYLARITHPDGTVTAVLGDVRGADLETFKTTMNTERPGSWAEFWNGVTRVSGFSHHVGAMKPGDVAGIQSFFDETLLRTGKLEIIEQTNLGQHAAARADTLELAQRIGATVTTGEQPTTQTPTSGVVATGTTITPHGPDARARAPVQSPLTRGLARLIQLDTVERTIRDWLPMFDEAGSRAQVDELLREIAASRTALRTTLSAATRAALGVRTAGTPLVGAPGRDYAAGPQGVAYTSALAAIETLTHAETLIGTEGFRQLEYMRTLPVSEVPLRVALHRAITKGEYSPQAFQYMLANLAPGSARSLLTGPRGGPSPKGKAFERVTAQWFTETNVMPLAHSASTAGFSRGGRMAARGVAGGLAALELFNQVGVPAWQEYEQHKVSSKNRDLYAFARRIAFWLQMGARPSVVGVEDDFFSTSPSRTRDFDTVIQGLQSGRWDAVAIESPGLSDVDVMVIGAFLAENVRNYDEYFELFRQSGQDAVRWDGSSWEQATWEIHVGWYDTNWGNEVEDRWEKHDRLTELMRALVPRWIANTEEHLERFGRGETLGEEQIATLGTFSHAGPAAPGKPLYKARLKAPSDSTKVRKSTISDSLAPHSKPFIDHTAHWNSPPLFFVHEDADKYAEVSGADFNTYATIRPFWTERSQHGLPYNTVYRVANESATCLIENSQLERIDESKPTPVPTPTPTLTPFYVEERIFFPFRGTEPRSDENYDYTHVLAEVARKLNEHLTATVRIVGHTDNVGESGMNQKLALARAESVKSLLVALGVAGERLTAEGAGMDEPIATNRTEDGRARNRRVEFEV